MKLVDMKEAPDADDSPSTYKEDAGPSYPPCLQISLDEDDLTKLGITELPEINEEMSLIAIVKVTRIEDSQNFYSGRRRCLGLQITEMALNEIGNEADEKY